MPVRHYSAAVRTAIEAELLTLMREASTVVQKGTVRSPVPEAGSNMSSPAKGVPEQTTSDLVAALNERAERLTLVSQWIQQDEHFRGLLDSVIGQQVKLAEQRLKRLNIVLNAVFLLLGWLLSVFATPAALAALFHK